LGFPVKSVPKTKRSFSQGLVLHAFGLPPSFFSGEFLDGTRQAMRFASMVMNEPKKYGLSDDKIPLENAFRVSWQKGLKILDDEGYSLQWDIERVDNAWLGKSVLIYGHRRSHHGSERKARIFEIFSDSVFVIPGNPSEKSMASFQEVAQALFLHGASVVVDAFVVVDQTLCLKRDDGEVIVASHKESTVHRLCMEGEIMPLDEGGCFDEMRGWHLVDFNRKLNTSPALPLC